MPRFALHLLLLVLLIVPEPLWAAVMMPAACSCEHGESVASAGEDEPDHAPSPCCPRMKAAADTTRDGVRTPVSACCCGVDQPQLTVGVEPPLPRLERLEAVDHALATPPVPSWWTLVLHPATRDAVLQRPARGPPPWRPTPSTALHVQHCVWRL